MAGNAIYLVEENRNIAKSVYFMRLRGSSEEIEKAGQFINIKLEGYYLRRPISVCDWGSNRMDIIYKILGHGTAQMAQYGAGTQLDILTGLGNGFDLEPVKKYVDSGQNKEVLLVGGGVGVPPLFGLAKTLLKQGIIPQVVLGFKSKEDIFYHEEFAKLGCKVQLCTEDGTAGQKGFVTDAMQGTEYDYYYTCGPEAMLKAVHGAGVQKNAQGQLSFEERMGCGFGACMGCSCKTLAGNKRICVEGPVMLAQEVNFDEE